MPKENPQPVRLNFYIFGVLILLFSSCQKSNRSDFQALFEKYYGEDTRQPGGSLFIAQEGKTVEDYSFGLADLKEGKANASSLKYRMASVSKHFTAYAIYQLMEDGELRLETKIDTVLKGMDDSYKKVTVGQLLNHTSGIRDYEELIPEDQENQLSDADVFDLIKDEEKTYFQPGTQFRYSNTGFCLLTLVVEEVTGLPYAEYMRQRVFAPNQLDAVIYEADKQPDSRTYGYHPLENGEFRFADQSLTSATKGDGGVYITPQEFSRWGRMLMKKWRDKDSYASFMNENRYPVIAGVDYSMGWFLLTDDQDKTVFGHSGETTGFHNIVVLDPERQESITLFTNRDDVLIGPAYDEVLRDAGEELSAYTPSLFEFLSGVYDNRVGE